MMKLGRYLREDGKKVVAVVSALLMIAFFLPSLRSSDPVSAAANRTVATVFDGVKITSGEAGTAAREWELVRRHLAILRQAGDDQPVPLADILGPQTVAAIDANPTEFLLLIEEAHHLGVGVSNDELQDVLHTHLVNMPDETDPSYDLARAAVNDVLLVRNMLMRVGDVVKISQPRQLHLLALTQQDVSLNIAELSAKQHLAAAQQPSEDQISAQYQRYQATLPGVPSSDDPLGFGYCLPDRLKIQYLGFSMQEVRDYVKGSRPLIEWTTLARRLYRTHTDDFPVATTAPTTQTVVLGPPTWETLPPDVAAKVFDQVYDTATNDLAKKMLDQMSEQFSADWASYREAAKKGAAAPTTSFGVAFNTDDYLRRLAASIQQQFGPRLVIGIINNGWKSADDLAMLEGIGTAVTQQDRPFAEYATSNGDQFKSAANLGESERMALWQPSMPVYTGLASLPANTPAEPTGIYLFRLSGMDPSHPAPLGEARSQVISDLLMQQAWNATVADADKLLAAARKSGLDSATGDLSPHPTMLRTDFFNLSSAETTGSIPGTDLKPATAKLLASGTVDLLGQTEGGQRPVTEVKLPMDRMVTVVELKGIRGNWQSQADQMQRLTELTQMAENEQAQEIQKGWTIFDLASKRTGYKEVAK